jgi:alkyldihydroxyacetonephosphate synthase
MGETRSWWGWGWADQQLDDDALEGLGAMLAQRFGVTSSRPSRPVDPAGLDVPAPRIAAPDALASMVSEDPVDRLRHGHGNAFRDVTRALHGDLDAVPDLVLRPGDGAEVAAALAWCAEVSVACVPWGGGTSVVGGVNPPAGPCVSLDLERLDRVLEVDDESGLARIEGGALGPAIEDQLRPHGLTLRHFPQSWEFSTLGGWLATRAGGHFATGPTHIDDLAASITAETPAGSWSSRRLPASGAGPSPDRWLLGSEGILGVITEAWMRVQPRPTSRAQATCAFPTFADGLRGVRALTRSGLQPANCRLLDPAEAALSGAADPEGTDTLLILGFEAVDRPLDAPMTEALELVRDHGGRVLDGPTFRTGDRTGTAGGGAGAWRSAFLQMPYLRDGIARLGGVAETFETATTWDRSADLVEHLREAATAAAGEVCGGGEVTVRTTHAYPDGIAPYLTVIAPGPGMALDGIERGRASAAAWDEIKEAVGEVIDAAGATITHHHAVGRDHRRWYDRQRPEPFAIALRAAKAALDPTGVCNPGVLLDPAPSLDSPAPPAPA